MGSSQPDTFILGQIMQSIPAIAVHIDQSGTCRLADESVLAAVTGLAERFTGDLSISQTLAAEILRQMPSAIDLKTIAKPRHFDIDVSAALGAVTHVRVCLFPASDGAGRRDGTILFCYDVTAQKRDESALSQNTSTLELLLACTNRANKTNDFRHALADCLQIICSYENWLYTGRLVGHAYVLDEDDPNRLLSSDIWCCPDRDAIAPFIELTRNTPIACGQGIPGRVLETGQPIWHGRASSYDKLPRAALADEHGLVSLVAVPVTEGDRVVAVMEFFADDERPPNAQLLEVLVAIGGELGSVYHRERANRHLRELADHDQLTGLVVMRIAHDRVERALAWAERHGDLAAVLFIDLDGFKAVNDEYGHDTGDELLREVAGTLERNVRDVDTVARFGGDEFIVVLSELYSREDAKGIADGILREIGLPIEIDGHQIRISASIGIVLSRGKRVTVDELIKRADDAMYRAKKAGKNRYEIHKS